MSPTLASLKVAWAMAGSVPLLLEPAQVAAAGRADVVAGILLGDLGELPRRGAQLGQQRLGLGLGLLALGRGRVLGRGDQDVAGAALLGRAQGGGVLLVVGAQVLLADVDGFLDAVQVEHGVFDVDRFGHLVLHLVRLVVALQVGLGRVDLGGEVLGRQAQRAPRAAPGRRSWRRPRWPG
jgi:hypothetical protein